MDADSRKKTLSEHVGTEPFFQRRIGFGKKRIMAEGHREYYHNEGVDVQGKPQGLFLYGVLNGKPTNDYIHIPPCERLLSSLKSTLDDCYDDVGLDPMFENSPCIVHDFIFSEHSLSTESLSRGRYGSRFKGMVVTKGIRFKIYLGVGVFIQPLIANKSPSVQDEFNESKAFLAVPGNQGYFRKLALAVEEFQTDLFVHTCMEMSNET
jgi:hypothetical protein